MPDVDSEAVVGLGAALDARAVLAPHGHGPGVPGCRALHHGDRPGVVRQPFTARLLLFHIDATYTREEYVSNERIVDRNPDAQCGVAFGFEPDATGTTLTMAWLDSSRVPLLTKVWDRIYWHGEHDLDAMLSSVKNAVETGRA